MYYFGTKQQCEEYDLLVTSNEKYSGKTSRWFEPKQHPSQDLWCVKKHPDYDSEMEEMESLSSDWYVFDIEQ